MILWRTFIFSQVEPISLLPGSNSTWYLLLSNGCNSSITFLGNSTPPRYVTINNSMHYVSRICFVSTEQMHIKALWTSFNFKHWSWCVSFTCLSFCSCKMTSQTVEEKTLTNKLFIIFFSSSISFSLFSLPSAVYTTSFSILSFSVFSFSLRWSLLTCLCVINCYFFWCPSCHK